MKYRLKVIRQCECPGKGHLSKGAILRDVDESIKSYLVGRGLAVVEEEIAEPEPVKEAPVKMKLVAKTPPVVAAEVSGSLEPVEMDKGAKGGSK